MKKSLIAVFSLFVLFFIPVEVFAWQGMPTPPLHVEGRWLKDPTGKNIMLHGWFQPTGGWFNGQLFTDPTTYTPANCAGSLNILKKQVDLMSNPLPLFSANHGWYNSFVRVITPSEGWSKDGTCDTTLQNRAWNNMYVPYIEYCKSHGLYVVFVGSCPDGGTYMSAQHKSNMIKFWSRIASYPGVKNADNVMFEICNEPIVIESVLGNGQWGSDTDAHDKAVRSFFQDIVDSIRVTGADNIIWVPGLIWQARLQNFAKYPILGKNIGYAGHKYPIGANIAEEITNSFNSDWKICSDKYPIIVTEGSWHTMGSDQGLRTGTTENFGNIMKNLYDKAGNISWICGFNGEAIGGLDAGKQPNLWSYPEINCGRSAFDWWPTYTWCAPEDGTPTFGYASVAENTPKQIKVTLSKPILDSIYFNGFTVKKDNQIILIDSVVLGDANQLVIHLNATILKSDTIQLSYNNGNVVSIYKKSLVAFNDVLVDNLLNGASPRIVELKTSKDGNTLLAKFNMKMLLPSDSSGFALKAEYNGNSSIPIRAITFSNNDSTLLAMALDQKVYADYRLLLTYSGNNISSSKNGVLNTFSDFSIKNYSIGLSPLIDTGKIETDGLSGILEFSKPLAMVIKQSAFTFKVNKKVIAFKDLYSFNNTVRFTLPNSLHFGDTLTVSYASGNVTATDLGPLRTISNYPISNPVKEPLWLSIPGKIEAEKYYSQLGIKTENTSDAGGGLDVGWIDNGDWLEYGINNNTSDSNYEIAFRVASPSTDGKFEFYLDNTKINQISVPNTGGYQTWKSVISSINISPGKHYLKLVATNSGFNINYCTITKSAVGLENLHDDGIMIYPNPVSKEMIIGSTGFRYNKVEIIDIMGKMVLSKLTTNEPETHIQLNLPNGMYLVRISNDKQFRLKRILFDTN